MAAAIGGPGTISGPVWGSLLLVLVQNWLALTIGETHYIVLGILFILVTLFFPGGIAELIAGARRFLFKKMQRKE